MQGKLFSRVLVGIQFATLFGLLLSGPWFAHTFPGLILQIAAILLGLWAAKTMRKFNIVPDPREDCILVCHGPYRWVRHPMYFSLILYFTPLVIEYGTSLRWGLWAVLLLDLVVKLLYEERLLTCKLTGYAAYCQRSKRLIPFLW